MLTNRLNLPQPFVNAATSNHKPTEGRYSVTRTLGGTCEAVLLRRHGDEIDGDVADAVWAVFGSAVHKILEESKETDTQLKENWLSVPIDGKYELSGIFDLYDDETGTVTDWKTCSVWKVKFNDFADWRTQTLAYCWMLRQLGFDARRGEIVALIKDHSKRDAIFKASEGYPPHPVFKVEWDFTDEDLAGEEARIRQWFDKVARQEAVPDPELEPCTPAERWHRDDKWAVMQRGKKRALRLLDSEGAAMAWMASRGLNPNDGKTYVEFRRGEDAKCEGYCDVRGWCPFYRAKVDEDF